MKFNRKHKIYILEVFMLLSSLVVIIPMLIMLMGSFKTPAEAVKFSIAPPTEWRFDNYTFVFTKGGIAVAMKNSMILTAATVLIIVISASLCSFIIARRKTRYTKTLYNIMTMGMVAPMQVITTFGLLKALNLMGSYTGVILVFAAGQIPWAVFIMTGFISSTVPKEMDEAAFIDGAGPLVMFSRIVLPLLKPVLATAVVIFALSVWNDFMIPLYFFNTTEKWTMPLTVYNFFGQYFSDWNYVFADLVLTALPVTILYLYFQKYVVAGMTTGAVKG